MVDRIWAVEVWLVAGTAEVETDEIRRFWRADEAPVLNKIVAGCPSLWIGTTEPPFPENDGLRGPVGRIIDVLALHGSTPDWKLPILDELLEAELLSAYAPQHEDPPRFRSVVATDLSKFLSEHRREWLVFRDSSLRP